MLRDRIRARLQQWHDWWTPVPTPPVPKTWQDYLRDFAWSAIKFFFVLFLKSLLFMAAPSKKK